MDELASKLNDLLGSSDGMEKIRNLASMLGASGQSSAPASEAPADPPDNSDSMDKIRSLINMLGVSGQPSGQQNRQNSAAPPDAGSIAPEGDRDLMRTLMKMAPLLSRFRQEDDSTRLLRCLRPFLSDTKKKKLDEAVKLMQFMRVIPYLKDSGLF